MLADVISYPRRVVAEALGTALLLAAVVGSGLMADRLTDDPAMMLLANAGATGAALVALIIALGPISGAHFNPVVTLGTAWSGHTRWRHLPGYALAQIAGAFAGVAAAHLMFDQPVFAASLTPRSGGNLVLSEFVATFGLVAIVTASVRSRGNLAALSVAAYITAAYWFTSSTSFANPAATLARAATTSFAGIRPVDAPAFIAAEVTGAIGAAALMRWLLSSTRQVSTNSTTHDT
jgi:glycerol uptake facilitator-like aquaporin